MRPYRTSFSLQAGHFPPPSAMTHPPNHRMVEIASVSADDSLSGLAAVDIRASSSEAGTGSGDEAAEDIVISGGRVRVRAERDGNGAGRTYVVTATATDVAGNSATRTGTCTVPHDKRPR